MALSKPELLFHSQWAAWREFLIPYFSDDTVITKLWCTAVVFQQLIRERTTQLVCHVHRSALPTEKYLNPPFLLQLTKLKYLQFVDGIYALNIGDINTISQFHLPYDQIPDSLTTLQLCYIDVWSEIPLMKFLSERPSLMVIAQTSPADSTALYWRLLHSAITTAVEGTNFKPLAVFDTFTTLDYITSSRLKRVWDTLLPDIKLWLEQHWCPKVNSIYFHPHFDELEVELWCYSVFPNITHCENSITTPIELQEYRSFNHVSMDPAPLPILSHLRCLTSLNVSVMDQMIPKMLPATLISCDLRVAVKGTGYRKLLPQFIAQLPTALLKFALHVNFASYLGPRRKTGSYWSSVMISSLPRALLEFTTNDFPSSITEWKLLPPALRILDVTPCTPDPKPDRYDNVYGKRNMLPTDANYQVVSPHLTSITVLISSAPAINLYPLPFQLDTVVRFQSLTDLNLGIEDENVLAEGFSSFPRSLTKLTLTVLHVDNTNDHISELIFPDQLKELYVKGTRTNNMIDPQLWHPLPDSLQALVLYDVFIMSLPPQWPTSITYLDLGSCSIIKYDYFNSAIDATDDIEHATAVEHAQMMSDPKVHASIMKVPRMCVIHRGRLHGEDIFVSVDRSNKTFSLVLDRELAWDVEYDVGDEIRDELN